MQYFIDSATGAAWSFDDDVVVTGTAGAYRFAASKANGSASLDTPSTLQPCTADESIGASAPKPLTGQALVQANTTALNALLSSAALQIAPLQDATDLGVVTDTETARLKALKQYRVALSRVNLTQTSPAWPEVPSS